MLRCQQMTDTVYFNGEEGRHEYGVIKSMCVPFRASDKCLAEKSQPA